MALPLLIAAAGVGAAASIWSAHEQSKAIEANAEFQGKIAELNAHMAELDAQEVLKQGIAQEQQYKTQAEQVQASQEAAFAQQGVEVKGDATGDLVAQSGLNAALNVMDIQNQAFINASKFKREATQTRLGSDVAKYNAALQSRSAMISGYAGAVQTGASAFIKSKG